ncbi:hypothetical protein ACHQM5_022020 [Ranunculus cassubicifolius]
MSIYQRKPPKTDLNPRFRSATLEINQQLLLMSIYNPNSRVDQRQPPKTRSRIPDSDLEHSYLERLSEDRTVENGGERENGKAKIRYKVEPRNTNRTRFVRT